MVKKLLNRIQKNRAIQDLLLNSFWSIIGTFISKVLLFLIWIFVAKILKADLYGEFSIIRSTTMLFADFVGSSIGIAGTNYIAKYYGSDNSKVERLLGLFNLFSFIFGLVLFVSALSCSDIIATNMLNRTDLTIYLQVSSIVILVSSINNNQYGILRGFNQYKRISKINLLQIIFSFPVYYLGTYFFSLKGAVGAYVFYNIIVCLLTRFELKKLFCTLQVKPSYKNCIQESQVILSFIFPYIISSFIVAFLSWYNETRLVGLPQGYAQMGYYSIINVVVLIIINMSFMVCAPFVSIMSKYRDSNSIYLLEKLNIFLPLLVALFISVPLMLFPEIIGWIYGPSYTIENIRLISNYMFFFAFLGVYRQAIARFVAVKEKSWLYFGDSVSFSLFSVCLFFYFYHYGVLGFVWGQTIACMTIVLLFLPLYLKSDILSRHLIKDSYLGLLFIQIILVFIFSFYDFSFVARSLLCIAILGGNLYLFYKKYLLSIKKI